MRILKIYSFLNKYISTYVNFKNLYRIAILNFLINKYVN